MASLLLLEILQYSSSSRLALLETRRKPSVRRTDRCSSAAALSFARRTAPRTPAAARSPRAIPPAPARGCNPTRLRRATRRPRGRRPVRRRSRRTRRGPGHLHPRRARRRSRRRPPHRRSTRRARSPRPWRRPPSSRQSSRRPTRRAEVEASGTGGGFTHVWFAMSQTRMPGQSSVEMHSTHA